MKKELSDAIEHLEVASAKLTERLAGFGDRGQYTAHRVGATAYDIVSFAFVLSDIDLQAREQVEEDIRQIRNNFHDALRRLAEKADRGFHGKALDRDEATRRLAVAYKAMLFFVRAYQDAIAAAVRVAAGDQPGDKTKMSDLLTKPSTTAAAIFAELPGYGPWFRGWKKIRDSVKNGITFGLAGPQDDLGIVPQNVTINDDGAHIEGNLKHAARMSDIAIGVEWSARIADELVAHIDHKG